MIATRNELWREAFSLAKVLRGTGSKLPEKVARFVALQEAIGESPEAFCKSVKFNAGTFYFWKNNCYTNGEFWAKLAAARQKPLIQSMNELGRKPQIAQPIEPQSTPPSTPPTPPTPSPVSAIKSPTITTPTTTFSHGGPRRGAGRKPNNTLAKNLETWVVNAKLTMIKLNISQRSLAEKINIHLSTVHRIFTGRQKADESQKLAILTAIDGTFVPTKTGRKQQQFQNLEPWVEMVRVKLLESGLTQREVSKTTGINTAKLSIILTGKEPASETHKNRILDAVGLSVLKTDTKSEPTKPEKPEKPEMSAKVENAVISPAPSELLTQGVQIRFENNGDVVLFSQIAYISVGTPQYVQLVTEMAKKANIPTV